MRNGSEARKSIYEKATHTETIMRYVCTIIIPFGRFYGFRVFFPLRSNDVRTPNEYIRVCYCGGKNIISACKKHIVRWAKEPENTKSTNIIDLWKMNETRETHSDAKKQKASGLAILHAFITSEMKKISHYTVDVHADDGIWWCLNAILHTGNFPHPKCVCGMCVFKKWWKKTKNESADKTNDVVVFSDSVLSQS